MKHHEVIINGVKYLPENTSSTADKPPGEKDVNYRALVNDKLDELKTFKECQEEEIELGNERNLCLAYDSHANSDWFVRAGRIQEIIKEYAFYGGDNERPLYLCIHDSDNWEKAYHLLLDNENFIKTGKRDE